jgi:Ca2+-binding EF-hand superfamily protein
LAAFSKLWTITATALSKEEAAEIMKRFDRNNDGVISYDEFLRFLKVRKRA